MNKEELDKVYNTLNDSQPFGIYKNSLFYKRFISRSKGGTAHYRLFEYTIRNGRLSEFQRKNDTDIFSVVLALIMCVAILFPFYKGIDFRVNGSIFSAIIYHGFAFIPILVLIFGPKITANNAKSDMEKKWKETNGKIPTIDELIQKEKEKHIFKPVFEFGR